MASGTATAKMPPRRGGVREALRQSEELHRIILTNISDSVFLTDDGGRFTFICPNVDNIFGYSFNEIYAMENISVLLGKDLFVPRQLDGVMELRNIERTVTDKGGAAHTVLINVKKVDIRYGARLYTCRDITEYKHVREELDKNIFHRKKVERNLALFFNLSADLFSITDRERLFKVNPAWTAVLGYKPAWLIGRSVSDLVHPEDAANNAALESKLRAGGVARYENRFRHKNGSFRWISWISTMSDDGQVHAVGRDITAKKKEEDEMKRRLLRFRLQAGRTYLVRELSPVVISSAFRDLLDIHYPGLVISRRGREHFMGAGGRDFRYLWLSDRPGSGSVRPDLARLEALIGALPGEQAVVVDSLEYLVHKNGFAAVLTFVCHLRELAFFGNHIILVGLDGPCLGRRQERLLEKETLPLERYPREDLPEESVQLLRLIMEDNSRGIHPTRTQVCRSLGLSHPTVRRRLAELISRELLWERRLGRMATVEITERGRAALRG